MGFKYVLEIKGHLVKEDGGYWSNTPLNEFLANCDDAKLMSVYIQQGQGEIVQIPATVKIAQVIVDV